MAARLTAFVAAGILSTPAAALAQYYGDLALRTNGSVVRAGDSLKVELLALAPVSGPFGAQVSYRFNETITVEDEDGRESPSVRERVVRRPPTPLIDGVDRLGSVLLDDTFSFGHGSETGRYEVEVAILPGGAVAPATHLRTCVAFRDPEDRSDRGPSACPLILRGIWRVTGPGWMTFEGTFPATGRYSAVLVRDDRVLGLIDAGVAPTGSGLLDLISPMLADLSGQTIDVVLHNHEEARSTTLARLTVPAGR